MPGKRGGRNGGHPAPVSPAPHSPQYRQCVGRDRSRAGRKTGSPVWRHPPSSTTRSLWRATPADANVSALKRVGTQTSSIALQCATRWGGRPAVSYLAAGPGGVEDGAACSIGAAVQCCGRGVVETAGAVRSRSRLMPGDRRVRAPAHIVRPTRYTTSASPTAGQGQPGALMGASPASWVPRGSAQQSGKLWHSAIAGRARSANGSAPGCDRLANSCAQRRDKGRMREASPLGSQGALGASGLRAARGAWNQHACMRSSLLPWEHRHYHTWRSSSARVGASMPRTAAGDTASPACVTHKSAGRRPPPLPSSAVM